MSSDFNIPDPRRPLQPLSPAVGRWKCLVCREGLLTVPDTEINAIRDFQANNANTPISTKLFDGRSLLLPKGIGEDVLLNEPPFAFTLDDSEIQELSAEQDKPSQIFAVAATSYGPAPPAQDKNSNEDYAISAIIKKPNGEAWAFAAVSDGVSTKTFWAARTSRIACLIAFKVFRQFIASDGNLFEDATLEKLQETLVNNLRDELKRDKLNLLEYSGTVPSNWAPEVYESHKDRDELWYNSTLLVTCLGPQAGLITYAGDGGIELVKTKKAGKTKSGNGKDIKEVLRSTENLTIDSFVSLGVSSKDFRAARITYDDDIAAVEVILSSDGVDRTLQMNSATLTYQQLKLDSSTSAKKKLHALLKLPNCELDNLSVARAARLTGKAKKGPASATYIDDEKAPTTTVQPDPKLTPPPPKGRIDRFMILPFVVGCFVGAGSTLGVIYLRGDTSSTIKKRATTTDRTEGNTAPTNQTESPANKAPSTATNANRQGTDKLPVSGRNNENKRAKQVEAKRAAPKQPSAKPKQAEAKKPEEKPTGSKQPEPKPTAKPSPPKPEITPKPSKE